MTGFLLDTNVLSEARKGRRADANVANWLENQNPTKHYVSVVTIMEIEIGIRSLERRDPPQGSILRRWLERSLLPTFDSRILPISLDIARRCAELYVPDRRLERDALIAATALIHGLVVATRNAKDYAHAGVPLFNPWNGHALERA